MLVEIQNLDTCRRRWLYMAHHRFGKTLTFFKTAKLASQLPYVDKVMFVVDRKDLD